MQLCLTACKDCNCSLCSFCTALDAKTCLANIAACPEHVPDIKVETRRHGLLWFQRVAKYDIHHAACIIQAYDICCADTVCAHWFVNIGVRVFVRFCAFLHVFARFCAFSMSQHAADMLRPCPRHKSRNEKTWSGLLPKIAQV